MFVCFDTVEDNNNFPLSTTIRFFDFVRKEVTVSRVSSLVETTTRLGRELSLSGYL